MADRRGMGHFIGDRDIGLALVELAEQIVVMNSLEIEADALMPPHEARDGGGQRVEGQRRQRRDA